MRNYRVVVSWRAFLVLFNFFIADHFWFLRSWPSSKWKSVVFLFLLVWRCISRDSWVHMLFDVFELHIGVVVDHIVSWLLWNWTTLGSFIIFIFIVWPSFRCISFNVETDWFFARSEGCFPLFAFKHGPLLILLDGVFSSSEIEFVVALVGISL